MQWDISSTIVMMQYFLWSQREIAGPLTDIQGRLDFIVLHIFVIRFYVTDPTVSVSRVS